MAKEVVNIGVSPNSGGDSVRAGGEKINSNFTELYDLLAGVQPVAFSGSYSDLTDKPTFSGDGTDLTAIQNDIAELMTTKANETDMLQAQADIAALESGKSDVSHNHTGVYAPVSALADKADVASPEFTGVPTAPTAAPDTSTTQIATTAFVVAQVGEGTGLGDMLKSLYDTDNDGRVNAADDALTAPWSGITGKPSLFPPEGHSHGLPDIGFGSTGAAIASATSPEEALETLGFADPSWPEGVLVFTNPGSGDPFLTDTATYAEVLGSLLAARVPTNFTTSTDFTLNWSPTSSQERVTVEASVEVLGFSGIPQGFTAEVLIIQDATGSRLVTWDAAVFEAYRDGADLACNPAANSKTLFFVMNHGDALLKVQRMDYE